MVIDIPVQKEGEWNAHKKITGISEIEIWTPIS